MGRAEAKRMKCCDLTSGQLRHKVEFFSLGTADDGQGGQTTTPVKVGGDSWCKVKNMSGSEKVRNGMLNTQQASKIWLRYRSDVTTKLYATLRGVDYQIRSVDNLEERDEWLELVIEKQVAI